MLFKIFRLFALFAMMTLFIIDSKTHSVDLWQFLSIPIIFIGVVGIGAANIRYQFFVSSIFKSKNSKELLLTFDDGPHPEKTPIVLSILKKHNIKAVFFVIGNRIAGNENILAQIHAEGHVLANHSYSHSYMFDLFSTKKVKQELLKTSELIKEIVGLKPRWFRPPFGVTNPNIARAVKALGLHVIAWNIRTKDTVAQDKSSFLTKVLNDANKGGAILLHDDRSFTIDVLDELVSSLISEKYSFPEPEQFFSIKAYA